VRHVLAPMGGVAVITAVVGSLASGGLATTPGKNGLIAYAQEPAPNTSRSSPPGLTGPARGRLRTQ
jgi:hypothetical protein